MVSRTTTILVVEDHPDTLDMFGLLLDAGGWHVTLATNAQAALVAARATTFDVLLIDVILPPTDAWALIRVLRSEGRLPKGIVSMTAHISTWATHESKAAGCQVHLDKPFSRLVLESALEMAVAA